MRKLEAHKVNPANDKLEIEVLDEPGAGGACHHYAISGFNLTTNDAAKETPLAEASLHIFFQNGPINEVGVNGVTHEALLAILIDRLEHFQAGPYANEYNATALVDLQNAQKALLDRTKERVSRGVEGTHAL